MRPIANVIAIVAVALILAAVPRTAALSQEEGPSIETFLNDLFGQDREAAPRADEAPAQQPSAPVRTVPENRAEMQLSFAPLVKQTAPAVVNVYADRVVQQRSPFAGDPFFERFFGQEMPHRSQRQSSLGSGVVIDPSGIVITNNHVIDGADEIRVAFSDGREYASEVVLKDETVDLAVLKIEAEETFQSVPVGDSDAVEVGDLVLAIGNPFGVGQTVTSGIVSALARNQVGISDFGFFIQTDAAINPGNSGGALIDMDGRLIGVNTAIFSRSGGSNGIGFAIPANMVRAFAAAAETGNDTFIRPYIGATFEPVTPDIAEAVGAQRISGALVNEVVDDGPAARAGLRPGDIVTAVNGRPVEHPDALGYRLATAGIGQTVELALLSQGERRTISIALEAPPEIEEQRIEGDNPFAGAVVADLTRQLAQRLRLPEPRGGVIVLDVDRRAPAAQYGLRPGDVIVAVNGESVGDVDGLVAVLDEGAAFWRFDIERGGRLMRQFVR
ncbi:DegQ family serine endoprotease [Pararhizobium haloflavum]|uniref:DegQ family serine endoprotease n=1 Tax=Pararhizobium haloflavum TaxID=2037914 RepID=UPI000C18D3A4|nr:DegQ family serine endoprotease [Pararhizobium haloflavum]